MKIRDRIKELRRVPARDLVPNPKNWRTHPKGQADALRAILAEIGFAGAVLAREQDGQLLLIDGHLRAETAPDQEIPVLVLDVTDEEADKLLATFDPLSAMAARDDEKLKALVAQIDTQAPALRKMLDDLTKERVKASTEQMGGLEYKIMVECADEEQQAVLLERFATEGIKCRALIS